MSSDVTTYIDPVLADLAEVVGAIGPDRYDDPTPCTELTVGELRTHVLGWVTFFGAALNDPDGSGGRPDPKQYDAPADPAEGAAVVRAAAAEVDRALAAGVAGEEVLMVQMAMPGESLLRMMLWEYLTHGHDLAASVGQPWNPPEGAVLDALEFAPSMLTDDYRGPGKDFGHQVDVPAEAPPLDRLLGFSGRDPGWKP